MRTYTRPNVTPAMWKELKQEVTKDLGVVLAGDEGETSTKGIKFSYKYNPATQEFTFVEISRSWFDPSEDAIIAKINDGINQALGSK